jgi:hypothetical protein
MSVIRLAAARVTGGGPAIGRHGSVVFRLSDVLRFYWLRLGATVALELGPDASERRERAVVVEGEPDHVFLLVSGFGSGAYSAKLLNGTKHLFSGFSQPRQCGDVVLRIATRTPGIPPLGR